LKEFQSGTDIMSFKFSRCDELDKNNYLNYKAGQYAIVDLGTTKDPEGPIRSFTLASSPTEKDSILISTRIRNTPFKQKFASLDLGAVVKLTCPMGEFVLHEDYSKPAVFLSGGIGVTPFRSMVKYATDKQLPIKIVVFDSNRNQSNILFKEEFDGWADINKNLRIIYTISEKEDLDHEQSSSAAKKDWEGEYGRIDKAMILKYIDNNILDNSIFYICGPSNMLKAMQSLLQEELEIPKERIKVEEFTGY
jgi:glycine betaine catabolism B